MRATTMDFPGHFEQIFQQLNYQRLHGQLCDCVIVVGSRHFKAHRAVLAACSTHFRALFTVAEGDSSISMIQLDSEVVTAEAFAALIDMMYTSTLMLGESNVMDVLLAASHLHLNTVVKACKHYLTTRTLPMSPPADRGHIEQQQQQTVAAAANSRLQRSFLLQQLGLSLVSSALNGAEDDGGGVSRGAGSVTDQRRLHKRKPPFSLTHSEGERLRQRPRLLPQVQSGAREGEDGGEGRSRGEELLSPDSHNKIADEDSKLDEAVGGVSDYARSLGQEDVQLPTQSDGGRRGAGPEPTTPTQLMLPRKEEYPDGMQMKDGGEEEEAQHMQVVVKSEPLSSPEPADETSDVTSQTEGSDKVEVAGEKLELSPDGSEHSFTEPQPSSHLLLPGTKGVEGGVVGGAEVREDLSFSEALDSSSGFRISSYLSTKSFECGMSTSLSTNPASASDNVPNTTMGEFRPDRDAARFLFGSDSTGATSSSSSSSLLLPPSQNLLSLEAQDFSSLQADTLLLRPLHDGIPSSPPSLAAPRERLALDFQRSSLGLHAVPRSSRGGGGGGGGGGSASVGFPAYRRIAPKAPPGGALSFVDDAHLQEGASSSSLLNGARYDGSASTAQRGNLTMNLNLNPPPPPPPQLTRASADVLSKCKKALSEHNVLVVEGARKYACKICCKTFLTLTDCKKHIRVHTGEKPYACLKCGKRFSQSSHLYKHSKTTCLRWQNSNMSNSLL